MRKNTKLAAITVFSLVLALGLILAFGKTGLAENSCPSNTQVGTNSATLVGEVTDTGGDPNLEVWFEYGKTYLVYETPHQSFHGTGIFCAEITGLDPCTTYNYRAVAKNSGGTSYGQTKSFTTQCLPSVDLKANDYDGSIEVSYGQTVTLSWKAKNAQTCEASGDWSGTKPTSGSEKVQLQEVKTYTFTLTCTNGNQKGEDTVVVKVKPNPPVVITKPAVVTY
jgi:hypothetical protein